MTKNQLIFDYSKRLTKIKKSIENLDIKMVFFLNSESMGGIKTVWLRELTKEISDIKEALKGYELPSA